MFDIQDSGMRHYTYISTLYHAMKVAAQYNKQMVIFDRPNPLGARMEGPVVTQQLKSFISIAQVPLRHGMTVGELAWYFNKYELEKPAELHVVRMHGYDRRARFVAQNELAQPLSPGLRTEQACYGYSFLGLLGE
ncbi:MAG: exo-beta-N-acetylmuramidase NamZ domain-containing protein, partial [Pseudomonadota bacterium]